MTSTVVAVLVVTLLLPGLALLFAVVIRLLTRGTRRTPGAHEPAGRQDDG